MKLAHLAVASAAALILMACTSEQEKAQSAQNEAAQSALLCQDPAVAPNVRESLQKMVRDEALKIAGSNYPDLVDADKLVAAAGLLEINLQQIQNQNGACSAELLVGIPKRIVNVAQQNAIILDMDKPNAIIKQRLSQHATQIDERTLSTHLAYTVTHQNQQFAITYNDTTLSSIGTALAIALQPYGVKDMLTINGKTISREQAIELIKNPKPAAPSAPEVAVKEVPTISQAASAPAKPHTPPPAAPQPETNTVPDTAQSDNTIAAEQLAQAEQEHKRADTEIKQAWRKIDPAIQQTLVEEQKTWESQKRQRCLKAAAQGNSDRESHYLHMQCDTKLTYERIKYLNGYSIQE
ncbi:lysozyme inhibitor LprI family protein [Alysiella filiformis]|uniref:Lysozyme inhibitor LprI-like N-terminal domain-containing protein n=1 Tax=Alysiella filiformis DSM 16848 TaxID=1120981 RepID=A0A286EHB1_9NEIS|nr:lysozyme inhibitor LprI family protein [Alysiella filiformis]QMT32348.1 DUF1311 domain-containing protein [Alysiella filiformis]UBQ56732.1 lysozyme inhibitor LprI family protein [Alysiella filiformis DSM 16848]SOD70209.1 Protein of unknown function [Alysiella filiformis DSM 16848]